jgi:hypothetical protein
MAKTGRQTRTVEFRRTGSDKYYVSRRLLYDTILHDTIRSGRTPISPELAADPALKQPDVLGRAYVVSIRNLRS